MGERGCAAYGINGCPGGERKDLYERLGGVEPRSGRDRARLHEECDEQRDERGRRLADGAPVDRPLVEDAHDEVAEDGAHEDGLQKD